MTGVIAGRLGLEGVIAKKATSRYEPNGRGWIKVKNPTYWRCDAKREAMVRKHERRATSPRARR